VRIPLLPVEDDVEVLEVEPPPLLTGNGVAVAELEPHAARHANVAATSHRIPVSLSIWALSAALPGSGPGQ